jgi:hypothetical protein
MSRREDLLKGILTFPKKILSAVNSQNDTVLEETMLDMWDNLWSNYLNEQTVDTITWYNKFNNKEIFNLLLAHLSIKNWITSTVDMNYAFMYINESKLLKWLTKEELIELKFRYKFNKYRMKDSTSNICDIVQLSHRYDKTGLVREGFMKAGNSSFKYDIKYLEKYIYEIAEQLQKGLSASTKDITYQEIIMELTNYYANNERNYSLGKCIIDSRGRAIHNCTKKIFNPIASKEARALLVCNPYKLTNDGLLVIYEAISELLGFKDKTIGLKQSHGKLAYLNKTLIEITENNYDNLHKRILLERIYEALDNKQDIWDIPITLDCTASMLEFIGILTNDHTYLKGTNLVKHEKGFQDIWSRDYVSRIHIKKAMTPQLYGSSKSAKELWDSNKLDYTQVQLNKMNEDIHIGIYANANKFKDFIINNVKPKAKMKVKIWNEEFTVECNRFKWESTVIEKYFIFTSSQNKLQIVRRILNLVPDLNQFKRYFVTLLCHNLDSQLADYLCRKLEWIIPIHDSFTVHPNDANSLRHYFIAFMKTLYVDRKAILYNYFNSIGIDKKYKEIDTEDVTSFSVFALK